MNKLFFDLETLPAGPETEPIVRELYEKFPDRRQTFEEYLRNTSLNSNFGRILCIGYALNDEPAQVLTGSEPDQLRGFWEVAKHADRLIGHNIVGFDLAFLFKKSMIHGIQPTLDLKPAEARIFDTKHVWDQWGGGAGSSLDTLAKLFGLESSKQGIDGSQVYDFYRAGKLKEIYAYCARDVELTRKIYQRLTFAD